MNVSSFFSVQSRFRRFVLYAAGFVVLVVPVLFVIFISHRQLKQELTDAVLAERSAYAELAAATLTERLARLRDVAEAIATNPSMRTFAAEGRWGEAIELVKPALKDMPAVDRMFLTDVHGTETADYPELPGAVGRNFAFRDWYRGVTKTWQPYVSEAYRRTAEPQYNVIAVAVPIFEEGERGLAAGILVLQVRVDMLVDWAKAINAGPEGVVFFVDRNGKAAAHPNIPAQAELADLSSLLSVQQIKQGRGGIGVLYSPIDQADFLEAYRPVPEYGFGVVVSQPAAVAFAVRDGTLGRLTAFGALAAAVNAALVVVFLRVMSVIERYRRREKLVFESMGDGVVTIDLTWKITYFSEMAERLSGWRRQEALGRPFRDVMRFIREQDKTENITFIEEAILFKVVKQMSNHTVLICKDGKEISVGDSAAPILDERGEVAGAIIVFRNAEHEREAQVLRSDFAYASHQLRTPVSKALWNMELALSETNMTAIQGEVKTAYLSLKSVRKLAESLLAVSRLDQKMVVPHITKVKLSDVCDAAMRELETKAREREFRFECPAFPKVKALEWETDAKLLEHALFEVLDNAISYSPPRGEATISTVQEKEGIVITVEDKGIGIPENQHPLVFTRFFRGSNINTTDIAGTGLGLYIAREYVKLLGGNVWFESVEGKGTAFRIFLPEKHA